MNNYSGQIHSFIPMTNFCKLLHVILVEKLAIGVKNNCTRAQASLNCTSAPEIPSSTGMNPHGELTHRMKKNHACTIKV